MEKGFAEALGNVGRRARAKANTPLGHEEEALVCRAGGGQVVRVEKDDTKLPPLFGCHSELVKVVLGVVAEYVEGFFKLARGGEQDGEVTHDGGEGGLDLTWTVRGCAPLGRLVQPALLQVLEPRRVLPELEPRRHVAHLRRLIDG